ncbi:MAG: TetR/AcrR family transcriptional regulator [Clostridiales bacterium]|jgi:AcrR family transcriptional regulator|nr:TetR/AcrR family transcriptional regulator [Clostridiales bacterium]
MPKRTFFRLDADKRERVIRSAIDEFLGNGYENAKIGAIAAGAKIANGSLYQYFDDKRELFRYCVNWTVENFIKEQDRLTPLAGMDIFEYITSGLPERARFWRQEPALARFAHELVSGGFGFPAGEPNMTRSPAEAHIERLIANGRKWGRLREDIDDEALTLYFSAVERAIEGEMLARAQASPNESEASAGQAGQSGEAGDALLAQLAELIKHGMAAKPAAADKPDGAT